MSDNTQINVGTGGDYVRDVDNSAYTTSTPATAKTQVFKPDFGGQTGESLVTTVNAFPTAATGGYFVVSTANSSSAQLAAGSSFTGTIEAIPIALDLSLNIPSDQPITVVVNFYEGVTSNTFCGSYTITGRAGVGVNRSVPANGNYCNIVVTNNGLATTTTLIINSQYGPISPTDQAGNTPSAIYGTDDLAGVNLLESVIRGDLALSTRPINLPQTDLNNATIISDSPIANRLTASTVGQTYIIDTQGYPSVAISMGTMAATLTGVNDLAGTWVSIPAMSVNGAVLTTSSLAANTTYVIPSVTRYMKLVVSTAGWATYFLRNIQSSSANMSQLPVNLVDIAGAAVSSTTAQFGMNVVQWGGAAVAYTNPVYASLVSIASTNGQTAGGIVVSSTTPAATVIKASAGRLTMLDLFNPSTAAAYFHVYNAASVTLGTTASIQSFGVPASGHRSVILPDGGLYLSTGICGAWTNLPATTDNTTLTASGQTTNYAYI